jgi:ADP-heptose:LPS heptosyltransferase
MSPRRTLVIAEGQLGDLLLLVPALRALKAGNAAMQLTVLVVQRRLPGADIAHAGPLLHEGGHAGTASVLKHLPYIDNILELDRSRLRALRGPARLRGEWEVIRALRRECFDAVICTFPEDRFVLWARASGARRRVGQYAQPLRGLLTDTPQIQKEDVGVLRYYLSLAAVLGGAPGDERTEFPVPASARMWARQFIATRCPGSAPLVTIHPGASGDYKIWPPERFSTLVATLRAKGVRVILCGGEMDGEVINHITTAHPSEIPVAQTGADPARLGALFGESDLCVTNDSGPRHLAIAVGAPSLAVFRRHHDRAWGVYAESDSCATVRAEEECPACPRGVCQDRRRDGERFGCLCVRMVSVEAVCDRALGMLSVSSSGTRRRSSDGTDQPAKV